MKVSTILKRAKAKIRNPKRWAQHTYARDVQGRRCSPNAAAAVCWCSLGAVRVVQRARSDETDAARTLRRAAAKFKASWGGRFDYVDSLNDERDHETVMRMFDAAIRIAEREESKR